ncbi:MAG: hypothetical protein M1818_007089 [Claussenomyces sp. TS43310]|nr:MAG: hypothetical protein M1818_007089 [Claussenomyces sp. TS43310]
MPFPRSIFLLLVLLVSIVTAVPAPIRSFQRNVERRSFKVDRVRNDRFLKHNGTKALIKAYRKWAIPLPDELANAVGQNEDLNIDGSNHHHDANLLTNSSAISVGKASASNINDNAKDSGTVTATPQTGDTEYLAPVTIGGQTLNMDFDTGSSDLWVFSTELNTAEQSGHTVYDPKRSTKFALIPGANFSISYGDGSDATGIVGTDTVNIGGATVTGQAVELATSVSDSFISNAQSNGLVGLAFSKLNTVRPTRQKTFFDNALSTLTEPLFTADLRAGAAGAYEFGAIDTTKFNGSLTWADIDASSGFWQFSSEKFSVNGVEMTAAGGQAIADTGTTLMLVHPVVVNAYYSQVFGAVNSAADGGVTFPCDSDLPDLSVDIGGTYMAVIPGSVINFAPVDDAGITCFGGLQSAGTSSFQIYGDIMFKAQFVVFNGGNNSIAMAPHA